ncbi:MAG: hypothetical protein A3A86_05370 [Elusimicrobia bacterium RIFCSPLOWO2_01_FULL_60_11]|nr:MAG: hypothetical protein A3A86_05370 [Elusimicrobia bacterium RIFCSPLOWO2_01_FULL_60_11]
MEKTYTTFQIAGMCGVKPTTIIKWIQQKRMPAFATPGGHRRVRESDLLKFLEQYRLPIPEGMGEKKRSRILVVEDEGTVGRLILRALKEAFGTEAEVEWIEDGIQALIELGKKPVDLVILDVVMPVVDGARVLASLRADPQTAQVKVIGITGKKLLGEKLKFMQEHTDAFFYKPFELHQIMGTVGALLSMHQKTFSEPKPTVAKTVRRIKTTKI